MKSELEQVVSRAQRGGSTSSTDLIILRKLNRAITPGLDRVKLICQAVNNKPKLFTEEEHQLVQDIYDVALSFSVVQQKIVSIDTGEEDIWGNPIINYYETYPVSMDLQF